MIVFDNIVFSIQKSGGISVVWYEILKRILLEKSFKSCFIEFDDASENMLRKQLMIPDEIIFHKNSFLFKICRYMNLRLSMMKDKFIFHSSYYRVSSNKNAINITTVHDFTYERLEHGFRKWIHCSQKYNAIRKSDLIICVSENTKQDLLKYLPEIDVSKIRVIHNGVSDDYFVLDRAKDYLLPFPAKSYILFVGSRKQHKKFDTAIQVARKLNMNLIIVGGGRLTDHELSLLDSEKEKLMYKFVGKINNSELNILYNFAFCLLYPSIYEGFGIPVIESQKAGCPVVAYSGSSIKEIIGPTPLLFNDHSVETICKYAAILFDEGTREEIIASGLINSSKFSWDKTYSQLISLYCEIL